MSIEGGEHNDAQKQSTEVVKEGGKNIKPDVDFLKRLEDTPESEVGSVFGSAINSLNRQAQGAAESVVERGHIYLGATLKGAGFSPDMVKNYTDQFASVAQTDQFKADIDAATVENIEFHTIGLKRSATEEVTGEIAFADEMIKALEHDIGYEEGSTVEQDLLAEDETNAASKEREVGYAREQYYLSNYSIDELESMSPETMQVAILNGLTGDPQVNGSPEELSQMAVQGAEIVQRRVKEYYRALYTRNRTQIDEVNRNEQLVAYYKTRLEETRAKKGELQQDLVAIDEGTYGNPSIDEQAKRYARIDIDPTEEGIIYK